MKNSAFNGPVMRKLAWSVATVITLGTSAFSTYAAESDQPAASELEEVTVTGSRIRRDDFSNPQPTTVVGGEMLENLGIVNLGDAMANLPSNIGNNTPTANAGGNFFNGANIANLRGLNPFFGSRTLTLVDSRRHVPTNQGDGVDLNFIPSILIDRMEVVTGGASASYGSGAIGGVTNILLDRDLDGGKVQVDFGTTAEDDGDDLHYAGAWGTAIGDSSHFVVGFEAQDMDSIDGCASARDWCAKAVGVATNAGFATNADPQFMVLPGQTTTNMTAAGMFPLLNLQFNADGTTLKSYTPANALNQGGDGRHIYKYTQIRSNVDRQVLFGTFSHDFSDSLSMFVEASMGSVDTFSPQGSLDLNFALLAPDNYYLNKLPVNPCASFPGPCFFNKDFSGQLQTANDTSTDLQRYAIGFSGKFGDSSWTWDAYYQSGESDRDQNVLDNRHARAFDFAIDVVPSIPGNYNSTPVCRVTRDGMPAGSLINPQIAQGCKPLNIFGTGALDAAGRAYAVGRLLENTVVEQDIIEGVASGELFDGFGAGPVLAAVGASWRDESIANIADQSQASYMRNDYLIQYGESFSGDVEVWEYFAELDAPLTDTFGIVGAVRRSDYTNTGGIGAGPAAGQDFDYGITTWKINANWEATDWLTLRASQSRDIRAPNFRELYYGQDIPSGPIFGYCTNPWTGVVNQGFFTLTGDPCKYELRGGYQNLKPEQADTTTLGFMLQPENLNVRFAADYYKIDIEDAITPANVGLTIDGCYAGNQAYCAQIQGTRNAAGAITDITVVRPEARNFRGYTSRGIDITADWVEELSFGTISNRLIASRVLEQLIQPNEATPTLTRNLAGTAFLSSNFLADWQSSPDWTAQVITTFVHGPVTVSTQARWVKEMKVWADRVGPADGGYNDNAAGSVSDNSLPNYVVWSLNGSYDFTLGDTNLNVFGSVNNLFDKDPPLAGLGNGGTSATFYDVIGRNYRVGLRASF